MGTTDMTEQHQIWNGLVGDAWVAHASVHDQQAGPFGEAAMQALGSLAGASVLDVGCGTGATSAQLAALGARDVLGVDLSQPMISSARTSNDRSNVRFEHADVLDLDAPATFDVIFSRFGVMFFDDPVAGFAHLSALGRPGARLAFCCWGPPAENPFMALPMLATMGVLGPLNLARPGEPGPFSLADPEVLDDVLDRAGWSDVDIQPLALEEPHPAGGADAVASVVIEFSPPIAEGLREHPDRADEVHDAIVEALRPHERDGVVHLGSRALIVTAHR
jgi:SAM-dependent methyltransferase